MSEPMRLLGHQVGPTKKRPVSATMRDHEGHEHGADPDEDEGEDRFHADDAQPGEGRRAADRQAEDHGAVGKGFGVIAFFAAPRRSEDHSEVSTGQPDEAGEIPEVNAHAAGAFVLGGVEAGPRGEDADEAVEHDEEPKREGDLRWHEEADADDREVDAGGTQVGGERIPRMVGEGAVDIEAEIDERHRGVTLMQPRKQVDDERDAGAGPEQRVAPEPIEPASAFRRGHEFEGDRGQRKGEAFVVDPLLPEDRRNEHCGSEDRADQHAPEERREKKGDDRHVPALHRVDTEPVVGDEGGGGILRRHEPGGHHLGDGAQPGEVLHQPVGGDEHRLEVAHQAAGGDGGANHHHRHDDDELPRRQRSATKEHEHRVDHQHQERHQRDDANGKVIADEGIVLEDVVVVGGEGGDEGDEREAEPHGPPGQRGPLPQAPQRAPFHPLGSGLRGAIDGVGGQIPRLLRPLPLTQGSGSLAVKHDGLFRHFGASRTISSGAPVSFIDTPARVLRAKRCSSAV